MLHQVRANRRNQRISKSKPRRYQSLQKPNGVISPRVQKVGGERFAIVCIDPAKHRRRSQMPVSGILSLCVAKIFLFLNCITNRVDFQFVTTSRQFIT